MKTVLSHKDEVFIKENLGKMSMPEMAISLGKKPCTIKGYCRRNNLSTGLLGKEKPEGHIRTVFIKGFPIKQIKVNGKFEKLSHHVYEQQYGSIPSGHGMLYKDGDSLNCSIDNLECLPQRELTKKQWAIPTTGRALGMLKRGTKLTNEDFPSELIELQRLNLQLKHNCL